MQNKRWTDNLTDDSNIELDREQRLTQDGKRLAKDAIARDTPIDEIPLNRDGETDEDREFVRNVARMEIARATRIELTEDQIERLLETQHKRFSLNRKLHEGISWSDVEASLRANPEALWSLAQMESAGHEPDVYHDDRNNFYLGTCSLDVPESSRNCVFDKKAAEMAKQEFPDRQFNGSAVEMAEAMDIFLMEYYLEALQKKGKFDAGTTSFLMTNKQVRATGHASVGGLNGPLGASVEMEDADYHHDKMGWRGMLKVRKISA